MKSINFSGSNDLLILTCPFVTELESAIVLKKAAIFTPPKSSTSIFILVVRDWLLELKLKSPAPGSESAVLVEKLYLKDMPP